MSEPCTVCGSERTSFFHESRDKLGHREFIHCAACDAVFVPRRMHLGFPAQRERYLIHENDPFDQGYRDFLDRLLAELAPLLTPGSRGLDYGAGPGPALAMMMRERGFRMSIYDPIFHPDEGALDGPYDFVTCTETFEHLCSPTGDLDRIDALLEPGGWLGVMTGMPDDWSAFPEWGLPPRPDPHRVLQLNDDALDSPAVRLAAMLSSAQRGTLQEANLNPRLIWVGPRDAPQSVI